MDPDQPADRSEHAVELRQLEHFVAVAKALLMHT
jgi:hypothetical protein